jgi:hypothetical protein
MRNDKFVEFKGLNGVFYNNTQNSYITTVQVKEGEFSSF